MDILGHIEEARIDLDSQGGHITVRGWVTHTNFRLSNLEICLEDTSKFKTPFYSRPDVQKAFPHIRHAAHSGFTQKIFIRGLNQVPKSLALKVFNLSGKLLGTISLNKYVVLVASQKAISEELRLDPIKFSFVAQQQEALRSFFKSNSELVFKKSRNPVLSIVLVTFNKPELILKTLFHIVGLKIRYELIIFDNASNVETLKLLFKTKGVSFYRNPTNLHFLSAAQFSAKKAKGKYILFLNSDCFVNPGAIESCLDLISKDKRVGTVGPKILNIDGTIQESGSIIWQNGSTTPYGWKTSANNLEYNFNRNVDYVSGAFLMTRKSTFEQLKGFDVDFKPAYYEDTDYCVRVSKMGLLNVYNSAASVVHFLSASSVNRNEPHQLIVKNRSIFEKKHRQFLKNKFKESEDNILLARSTDKSKRLLYLDYHIPRVSNGSGFPRAVEILNNFIKRGFQISIVAMGNEPHLHQNIFNFPSNIEMASDMDFSRLSKFLLARKDYYDYIWISRPEVIGMFSQILGAFDIQLKGKIIFDAEAIAAFREGQRKALMAPVSGYRLSEALKAELDIYKRANVVVAVSDQDAKIFSRFYKNVVALGHFHKIQKDVAPFAERDHFLFVGPISDTISPNYDSLKWFIEEIWPKIRKEIPEAQLHCVGKYHSSNIDALKSTQVFFHGQVADVEPFFHKSRVMIAPTRFAAGLPYKCTESASFGLPMVITPILGRQLGWTHKKESMISRDEKEFAQACIELYSNPTVWKRISFQSLAFAKKNYGIQRLQGLLDKILN